MKEIKVAVVMTVFNRVEKTKKCLDSILRETLFGSFLLSFFITNDGSTDNTVEVLHDYQIKYKNIRFYILQGTGSLYWNKGMHRSYERALKTQVDYYLWVNNDVVFQPGFLSSIIADYEQLKQRNAIICGSVSYTDSNVLSYGGAIQKSWVNPYKRQYVQPTGRPEKCDCVNGNCLLIPYTVAQEIGNVDVFYEHGFGDYDYGYRLLKAGGQPYIASIFVGSCDRNSEKGTWKDPCVPVKERIKKKNSPTGQPFASHKYFLKKWFPTFWPYYLYKPYARILITSAIQRVKR